MTLTTGIFAVGIDIDPTDTVSGDVLTARVVAAENAGFTFATFDDTPVAGDGPRVDAITRAAFVAATTSTIGLVPLAGTTYSEPFHVSSQLASLDYASRGRGGWIAARTDPRAADALGTPAVTGTAELAQEQRDSITVVRDLWDSWEDDAVVRNAATGRFLDASKLHYVDFVGQTFTVKGPAIVPRPPQGQLVVFGRDGDIDPQQVDVVLVSGTRPLVAALVVEEISIDLVDSESAAALLDRLIALADEVDGVRLLPTDVDRDVRAIARYVLPPLFERGIAHRPVPGTSLRQSLGLTRPANRFGATA
ncbi:putative FMNH2-utilizing oxygenase [Rhodococcoides trifolii]|uniref:FMNH2-utilizing oxygenase n=1 Tax=Rhodococcoides trifolii TaxID=908250 RepID=A0A917CMZ7_9NOCA|nr:LLM class flavin-dependent oxidoreductase [Rhodococcus trifolii]GGF94155.1 putative FMNH2-utilizing oxygenase [Rhodococcus trifolii]